METEGAARASGNSSGKHSVRQFNCGEHLLGLDRDRDAFFQYQICYQRALPLSCSAWRDAKRGRLFEYSDSAPDENRGAIPGSERTRHNLGCDHCALGLCPLLIARWSVSTVVAIDPARWLSGISDGASYASRSDNQWRSLQACCSVSAALLSTARRGSRLLHVALENKTDSAIDRWPQSRR